MSGDTSVTVSERAARRIGEILLEFSPTTNPENRGEGAEKLYYVFSFLSGDIDND